MAEYKVGEIIEGTIINIRDFGAIMIFNDGKKGLLHISEVANVFIRNIHKYLKIGKTYQVKIIGIEDDGFLKLSMSKISDEEKEEYHKNGVKRVKIDPEFIDYSALKEKLDEWISIEKEQKDD
jgi:predicted RNA-binding protein with RPS1 domain